MHWLEGGGGRDVDGVEWEVVQSCEIERVEARLTCIHPAHGRPVPVSDVIDSPSGSE